MNIKKIPERDCLAFYKLKQNAYPSVSLYKKDADFFRNNIFRATQKKRKNIDYYGFYEDNLLLGGMTLYSFILNFNGTSISACGLGGVAVDLHHKKERICLSMVSQFHELFRTRKTPIAMLYPFKPEFYGKMGYGLGAHEYIYRLAPEMLPDLGDGKKAARLNSDNTSEILDCYNSKFLNQHGFIRRSEEDYKYFLDEENRFSCAGFYKGNSLEGYLFFKFSDANKDSFLKYDLVVGEMIYNSPFALASMLSFLKSQADQVNRIKIYTGDNCFHHLFANPSDDSGILHPGILHQYGAFGSSMMYRIIDVKEFFRSLKSHCFGMDMTISILILDDLEACCNGSFIIRFSNGGYPEILEKGDADVSISMKINHFSSLIMGAIDYKTLYAMGLSEISDQTRINDVHMLFNSPKPNCLTHF